MKRIITFLFIIVLLFGCEGKKESDTQTQDTSQENTSETAPDDSGDLIASMAELPGLVESPTEGTFVELVKAIDGVYTGGTITIQVFPFGRSIDNVLTGKADFHIPMLRNPNQSEEDFPYRTVTESLGTVAIVIYSHVDNIITRDEIINAVRAGGEFPYVIEVPGGFETFFEFEGIISNDIEGSLKKLSNKRIDAFIRAQEETDLVLRELKMSEIHRALYANFDDAILIQKGPGSDELNNILSEALQELKASGKHEELYSKVHLPYDNWQPADMGW